MKPLWKHIYPWIKTAVLNLDSTDALLRQVVERIAATYEADCLLWSGLEFGGSDTLRVYATPDAATRWAKSMGLTTLFAEGVQQLRPCSLPLWLLDQQTMPRLMQLETGELIVPITLRGGGPDPHASSLASFANPLQFVLQLSRVPYRIPNPVADRAQEMACPDEASTAQLSTAHLSAAPLSAVQWPEIHIAEGLDSHSFPSSYGAAIAQTSPPHIQGWTTDELESIEMVCSQIGLAYSALYWRQRLEQSRQQASLVARVSRLLNSTLNPDEIVGRIVAELGLGLQCDRTVLVDLRQDLVNILATWDHPDHSFRPLDYHPSHQDSWQNMVEMFLQGGASYLQVGLSELNPHSLKVWLQDIGAQSVLLVPLFIQEEFFGTVALLSYRDERVYLLDELQTVRQVADQAAIALTNAQHYQSLWHRKEMLRLQNNSLRQEILRDDLTQLLNRRALEQELEQLSTGTVWRIQSPFSVIVCDIDYFKSVNDAHGHLVGDEVLHALALRLQSQLRRGTAAYRYGGEEFVIILTETSLERACEVAERLRQTVDAQPFNTQAGPLSLSASFGVAQQETSADHSAWDVLRRADQALYDAKRLGRDRVQAALLPNSEV